MADDIFFTEVFSFDDNVGHNHVRSEGLGVRSEAHGQHFFQFGNDSCGLGVLVNADSPIC